MEGLVNLENSIFNAKKLSDEDILKIISKIIEERNEIQKLLPTEDAIKNPKKLSKLSKRLNELNEICSHAEQLKNNLNNLKELEKILKENLSEADRKEY
ncbi:PCRF domain-containing protein, partial [Peptococcaceae bacterium]|nr:PCRF domain-containing protein [Peptococcaceae bacterium]